MRRVLCVLALLLWGGVALARDIPVEWINGNPAEVDVTELQWRNPTDWSSTVALTWADRNYTLTGAVPGDIEFRVRFCTTAEGYEASCSSWVGRPAQVPSDMSDVIITAP
jgi:hypothetical protein